MSWSSNLIKEILNPKNLIISSELAVVIADKYPKAQHHYLVLPLADIPSIFQLNRSHLPLLEELYLLAKNVVEVKGVQWSDFQVGFHAEPSMQRLHLHVISKDFVSPSLKTKKHWNSFNTELFVPYEKLYALLEKENAFSRLPKSLKDELLNKPLLCNQCEFVGKNLPTLKEHLVQHLQDATRTTSDKMEKDEKAYFRDELKRKLRDKRNFLIETDRAVVIKADFPKSQFHFRVVAKEELRDIIELTEDHLPLLDHMMELANQIIEQQDHLESRNFRIGFKVHTFWNRLNLHVLSDDFYSMAMKRARHWNSFNTELFMPFQMVHMLLSLQGHIDPISDEKFDELRNQKPLQCNQCEFSTDLVLDLKAHLYHHWHRQEGERKKRNMEKIVRMLDEAKLDDADPSVVKLDDEAAGPSQPKPEVKAETENNQIPTQSPMVYGPPVNMMNQMSPNNPFRNTPPLNINSLNPPGPQHRFNYRHPRFNPHRMSGPNGPRAPWNGHRFPPNPNWNPQTGFTPGPPMNQANSNWNPQTGFTPGPPMNQTNSNWNPQTGFTPGPPMNQANSNWNPQAGFRPQYPNQPIDVGGNVPDGLPNSVRPKWVHKTQQKQNFQYKNNQNPNKPEQKPNFQNQNQQIPQQQGPITQHPAQYAFPNQQNRPNSNPQNRQNSNQNNHQNPNQQNPQNRPNPNKQKYKNKKPAKRTQGQGTQAPPPPGSANPAGGS